MSLDGGYGLTDHLALIAAGAEYEPHPVLVLRAGYCHMLENQELEGLTGLTAGLGFRFQAWGLDYAFQPFGELAVSHRVGIVFRPLVKQPGGYAGRDRRNPQQAVPRPPRAKGG
jgi:hypothetical protein